MGVEAPKGEAYCWYKDYRVFLLGGGILLCFFLLGGGGADSTSSATLGSSFPLSTPGMSTIPGHIPAISQNTGVLDPVPGFISDFLSNILSLDHRLDSISRQDVPPELSACCTFVLRNRIRNTLLGARDMLDEANTNYYPILNGILYLMTFKWVNRLLLRNSRAQTQPESGQPAEQAVQTESTEPEVQTAELAVQTETGQGGELAVQTETAELAVQTETGQTADLAMQTDEDMSKESIG